MQNHIRSKLAAIALAAPALLAIACSGGGGGSGAAAVLAPQPLTITPAALPGASLGVAYSAQLDVSGGRTPYRWLAANPAQLPPGLVVVTSTAATTTIAGTPSQAGSYSFGVVVTDPDGRLGQKSYSLTVADAMAITTASAPDGEDDAPYAHRITATGGVGPYAWTVASGSLPAGLTLGASTGLSVQIEGVPTAAGTFPFTLRVEDSQGRSAQRALSIRIAQTYEIYARADLDVANQYELYKIVVTENLTPRAPVKVSGNIIPSGGDVSAQALSPDGNWLAYLADAEVDGESELFVVGVKGNASRIARKVNADFTAPTGAAITSYIWSPNSRYLAWQADADVANEYHIYVADVTQATIVPHKVSVVPSPFSNTGGGKWSSDSAFFFFRGETVTNTIDLYSVDVRGATPAAAVLLSTNRIPSGADVEEYYPVPGGAECLFVGDMDVLSQDELYTVTATAAAPAPTKVFPAGTGLDVSTNASRGQRNDFSPDGSKFAMRLLSSSRDSVYVAPNLGGTLGTLVSVTGTGDINAYDWSPDSKKLVLNVTLGSNRLHAVDVSGATPGPLVPVTTSSLSGTAPEKSFGWTPDSKKVWYRNNLTGVREFFIVDLSGPTPGAPQKLNATVTASGSTVGVGGSRTPTIDWNAFSPDGTQVAFVSDQFTDDEDLLYLNDISAATPAGPEQVSPAPASAGADACGVMGWTADSKALLFRGDFASAGQLRLYMFDVQNGVPQTGLIDLIPTFGAGNAGTGLDFVITD